MTPSASLRTLLASVLVAGLLLGCQNATTTSRAAASVRVVPGFKRQLQSIRPFDVADVTHLTLTLFSLATGSEVQVATTDLQPGGFTEGFTFTNLLASTPYRVRAYAYASVDDSKLVSNTLAGSSLDFNVYTDNVLAVASVPVQLTTLSAPGVTTVFGGVTLASPADVTGDAAGNIYVANNTNGTVTKITPAGVSSIFASGLTTPRSLVFNAAGDAFIACSTPGTIFKVPAGGSAAAFATGLSGVSGVTVDAGGALYASDTNNRRIVSIDSAGGVTAIAGGSGSGSADGVGANATFASPTGIAVDAAGNIYVADSSNSKIRKISKSGLVSTFASIPTPNGVTVDAAGYVYVADNNNNRIWRVTPGGTATVMAGSGTASTTDGFGTSATFNGPYNVWFQATSGALYVVDISGLKIRKLQ